jgi:hypothetical protein
MDEQTQRKSDSAGGEDALRELAVRLLTFHHSLLVAGQQVQEPQLLVGQLPPDCPWSYRCRTGAVSSAPSQWRTR